MSLQQYQDRFQKQLIRKEKQTGEYRHLKQLTPYINCKTKIKFKCMNCGLIFTKLPYSVLHCNYICMNKAYQYGFKKTKQVRKFTLSEIKKKVKNLVGDKYIILSKHYKNSHTKLLFEHISKSCVYYQKYHKYYKFMMAWNTFKQGHFCPKDGRHKSNDNVRITEDKFQQIIYHQTHGEYILESKYINIHTDVLMEHRSKQCPYYINHHKYYQWWTNPSGFIYSKCRCPIEHHAKISKFRSKSTEQYKNDVIKAAGDQFKLLSAYKSERIKVAIMHKSKQCPYYQKYGKYYVFHVLPTNFIAHPLCHYDGISCGEKMVMKWLSKHNLIQYKNYYYAYILKHHYYTKHRQHLDFYLPKVTFGTYDTNGIGIEFDGLQHYKMVDFTFNNHSDNHILRACNNLIDNMIRDRIKNEYCYYHRIKLIRIKNSCNYKGKRLSKLVNNTLNRELLKII